MGVHWSASAAAHFASVLKAESLHFGAALQHVATSALAQAGPAQSVASFVVSYIFPAPQCWGWVLKKSHLARAGKRRNRTASHEGRKHRAVRKTRSGGFETRRVAMR